MNASLKYILAICFSLVSGPFLFAQNEVPTVPEGAVWEDLSADFREEMHRAAVNIISQGDSMLRAYDFEGAVEAYTTVSGMHLDTSQKIYVEKALMNAQNGNSMMSYCCRPVPVARQRFSLNDFFLYYPLPDGSWRPSPNPLDTLGTGSVVKAMYIPEGTDDIFFSATDEDGIRNLYETIFLDTLWLAPTLLGEAVTSSADEIFPMVSSDGQSLFFSSKGLYGMGGYDLYVSTWDKVRREWSTPENLGFPYSSPADDFLFINTDDGKYSFFASNRDCSTDSVYVYVVEYDSMPVRTSISNIDELRELSMLIPADDPSRIDNKAAVKNAIKEDDDTGRYTEKMLQVRALRDSVYVCEKNLSEARYELVSASSSVKSELSDYIKAQEMFLDSLQEQLTLTSKELQSIEMDFLLSGIVINPEQLQRDLDKEVVGVSTGYVFTKNSMGEPLAMKVEKPEPKFDYTFMILSEGRFAEDNTIPSGLVYQIQIATRNRQITVADLNGLSPVFERKTNVGYAYSVGVFRSYDAVLSNLNKVKGRGFKDAFIIAWLEGKSVSVKTARELEKEVVKQSYQVRIIPANGSSLSDNERGAIQASSNKDLSRVVSDGTTVFILGPFNDQDEAQQAASKIRSFGLSGITVEAVK